MCDFIYFSSLAHLTRAGQPRKVVFLHVPCHSSPDAIDSGVSVVQELIRSLAESELAGRKREQNEARQQ